MAQSYPLVEMQQCQQKQCPNSKRNEGPSTMAGSRALKLAERTLPANAGELAVGADDGRNGGGVGGMEAFLGISLVQIQREKGSGEAAPGGGSIQTHPSPLDPTPPAASLPPSSTLPAQLCPQHCPPPPPSYRPRWVLLISSAEVGRLWPGCQHSGSAQRTAKLTLCLLFSSSHQCSMHSSGSFAQKDLAVNVISLLLVLTRLAGQRGIF